MALHRQGLCGLLAWVTLVFVFQPAATGGETKLELIQSNERLSSWLLKNEGHGRLYNPIIHWQVPAERANQEKLRQAIIDQLDDLKPSGADGPRHEALVAWLSSLQMTGRVYLANTDPYRLLGTPRQDPELQKGQTVAIGGRPDSVTLVNESAQPCTLIHQPGFQIQDYLNRCWGMSMAATVDFAWIAQADGRTRKFGIANWNREPQDEPGQGSWIWAPSRLASLPPHLSDNLIRLLATQMPVENLEKMREPLSTALQNTKGGMPRAAQLTSSDWGEIGLLQTPTARMSPTGGIRIHTSRVSPYTRGTVMFQPLEWLEAGFRYTDVSNRLYGPVIAGDQSYKDKSIDFKLRVMEESAVMPQVALGVRDLGGTGLFSGEYLVASKRWGNWDASIGLGWGYLGSRGNIKNPLSNLSKDFETRPGNETATGGTANFQSMFRGSTALFGGLQWHSPSDNLLLKLELDGNDYQNEPQDNRQPARSPLNLGLVYRYSPFVDLSLGVERGNRLSVGLTVQGELPKLNAPKLLDPVLPPVRPTANRPASGNGWEATANAIELHTGWTVKEIAQVDGTATVVAEVNAALFLKERIERATIILHQVADTSVSRFVLQLQERGLAMSQVEIGRSDWLTGYIQAETASLRPLVQQILPASERTSGDEISSTTDGNWRAAKRGLSTEWGPSYSQILGGPDGFLLYQLGLQARVEHRWTDQTWVIGAINARLLDNYAQFVYDAPSNLPRVRTNQREYTTTSRLTLPLLQLTHVSPIGKNHFFSAYAGMLESMYGGIGAEWLYRPWQGRTAFGIDINHVRQRDFAQGFGFRDYRVTTGHGTIYWDTGWNDLHVNLSAGRYLAGDYGATLDIKRTFRNGVALGAWATKTNVAAEDFGEGSFDKGIYVNIPFDVMMPKSSAGNGTLVWNPLTRDGGARLSRRYPLIDVTRQRDPKAFLWNAFESFPPDTGDDQSYVLGPEKAGLLGSLSSSGKALGMQIADVPASTWLWASAGVLASSLMDRTVDEWAASHQGSPWQGMGKASSALPLALAAATGLLYTGLAGDDASSAAKTSLTAGLFTLGANMAMRFTVGRSRPMDGEGPYTFNGLNKSAFNSGFASNHVALAFALTTPFAQQYNMPWLYALASASAFGRVQQREHWLSDTVAGAFMGYAVGSLVTQQQSDLRRMRLSLSPQSVKAEWSFN